MGKLNFALVLVLAFLISCSVGDGEIVKRYDENDREFSPASLAGNFLYIKTMKPEEVRIVALDDKLNPLDSFVVPLEHSYTSYDFITKSYDYEYPYAKIVVVFPQEKKGKMELAQYTRFTTYMDNIKLHFYGALAAGRIKTLVQEENFKFDDAVDSSYRELENVLGTTLNFSYGYLVDVLPYLICRHEVSDSVFYHDFKEFRDSFAKNGKVDRSFMVRAADTWLSFFDASSGSGYKGLYESASRDTAIGMKTIDINFIHRAYGLDALKKSEKRIEIDDKSSQFHGRTLVEDFHYNQSVEGSWRFQTLFEDTVGACLYDGGLYVEHDGKDYVCRRGAHKWMQETNRDTLLLYKYGTCSKNDASGKVGFVNDTMFVCDVQNSKGEWKVVRDLYEGDSLNAETLNVLATERYGKCEEPLHFGGEAKLMDSMYVQCSNYKWMPIDSLTYYMGVCPGDNFGKAKKMPDGNYYECGLEGWSLSTIPKVMGFVCDDRADSTYKKYDGKYFYCVDETWEEVPEEDVILPVVKGDVCDENNLAEMKRYGDKYFVCRGRVSNTPHRSTHWSVATIQEKVLFDYDFAYSTVACKNGRKGTNIWWNPEAEALYGCYEESIVMIKVASVDDEAQQLFAGGSFTDNVTYEVTVDGYEYGFNKFHWSDLAKYGWDRYVIMEYSYKKKVD